MVPTAKLPPVTDTIRTAVGATPSELTKFRPDMVILDVTSSVRAAKTNAPPASGGSLSKTVRLIVRLSGADRVSPSSAVTVTVAVATSKPALNVRLSSAAFRLALSPDSVIVVTPLDTVSVRPTDRSFKLSPKPTTPPVAANFKVRLPLSKSLT